MQLNRRGVLKGMGAAGVVTTAGLAGCLGGVDDDDDDDGADDAEDTDYEMDDAGTDGDLEVMIGTLMPTTGDLGTLGSPIEDAAVLPGIQLEDEGIDYEIDIRTEDTETDPEAGMTAAQRLVDAGYPAITGAAASNVTIAVAEDVLFPNNVVAISPASTSPAITDMDGDYLLRTAPSDAWQGDAMAEIAVEELGAETISSFHLNDDYGQGLSDVFVEGVEDRGAEVLEVEAFEPEQPSYDSELQVVLGDEPDLLMIVGFPESGEQIFRDYYANFDGDEDILVPDGLIEDDLPGNVDNPMENVTGTAPSARGPGEDAFNEMYEDEYGRAPGVFNAQAYDATAVLILATLYAGETDGPRISEAVRAVANPGGEEIGPENLAEGVELAADGELVNYQGASGAVDFDENGDVMAVTYDTYEADMDGFHVLDTIEYEAE